MKDTMMSHLAGTQLRALLVLSRELLEADAAEGVLSLVGRAVADVAGAAAGLLILRGEYEHVAGFDHCGAVRPVAIDHPFYRAVAGAFTDEWTGHDSAMHARGALLVGAPSPAPAAALAGWWDDGADSGTWDEREQMLRSILELALAAMRSVEMRGSLERLVLAQYGQLADSEEVHAAELERRDVAEKEIRVLSLTDLLTGLNNRRGFFVHAEPVFRVAQRRLEDSAVIFADIDGLKLVNDELGHGSGDDLIRDAARLFRASFRQADVIARLGGDEFVSYSLDEAHPDVILDRLQDKLHAFNCQRQRPYQIAVSVGVVRCDPGGEQELARYLLQADQQMYANKRRRLH